MHQQISLLIALVPVFAYVSLADPPPPPALPNPKFQLTPHPICATISLGCTSSPNSTCRRLASTAASYLGLVPTDPSLRGGGGGGPKETAAVGQNLMCIVAH